MRVLITGARGQLGHSLRERIPEDWEAIFTDSKTLNITNKTSVTAMIDGFQPEVIINTAAYTNVDKAETEPEAAFAVNATGVAYLAQAAHKVGSHLIHISTDFVFDGQAQNPYTPEDAPHPINVYGKSKLAGELLALAFCGQTNIVRTSWAFSEHGHNFVNQIVPRLLNDKKITITANNIGTPTHTDDLANFLIALSMRPVNQKIIHYCGSSIVSRGELAHIIASLLQQHTGDEYEVDYDDSAAHATTAAPRPLYSPLLATDCGVTCPPCPTLKQHLTDLIQRRHGAN